MAINIKRRSFNHHTGYKAMKELTKRDLELISELMSESARVLELKANESGRTSALTPKLYYWAKKLLNVKV
jgi:hypothetical protein